MLRRLITLFTRPSLTIVGGEKSGKSISYPKAPVFGASKCRWKNAGQRNPSFIMYRCESCGAEAYSRDGKAPNTCKNGLDGRL